MRPKKAVEVPTVTQPTMQPPLAVPVKEAARLLSVSTWEVRRLVRRGALCCKKLGHTKWLVTTRSLHAFVSEASR